jgi:fructuronate reductase
MGQIVHFGLGNFARAHLLDYTSDAGGWDVIGVSLRSASARDGLAPQGFDYTLNVQGKGLKRIQVLADILVASEGPEAILAAMHCADIISATVTEKGYHLGIGNQLDINDPAIISDLNGNPLQTLIGYIAHHLAERSRPVTILSCDNRVENGTCLQQAVASFAQAAGLKIDYGNVRFPNAMVDRITPATTDAIRTSSADPMAVPTEAFREWVLEDNFAGARPAWPDVQLVQDVRPHELRKLRILNGAHSFLAYAGLGLGYSYVHEAMADPYLRRRTKQLMTEAGATLPAALQDQVPDYINALLARFDNVELAHRLDQIAMDGSQKIPYRFLETLRAGHGPIVAEAVRSWMEFCRVQTSNGRVLNDPKALDIARAVHSENPEAALLEVIGARDLAALVLG